MSTEAVAQIVEPSKRSVGAFTVARALPSRTLKMVGPFAFMDHFGPVEIPPGQGADVRPHPHLHLSTVTYLFAGEMFHRDSVGSAQLIEPGAINWMNAGRGIVHSERSTARVREHGGPAHGLQLWVAAPLEGEDVDPSFSHHPAASLPDLAPAPGVHVRLLAGSAYGRDAGVPVQSPLVYMDVRLEPGARFELPGEHRERAVYLVEGEVEIGAIRLGVGRLALLSPAATELAAIGAKPTRLVLIGGEPVGPRYIWWNFVSSKKEAIVEAARAWRAGELPKVPGDEVEYIPLETLPHFPD